MKAAEAKEEVKDEEEDDKKDDVAMETKEEVTCLTCSSGRAWVCIVCKDVVIVPSSISCSCERICLLETKEEEEEEMDESPPEVVLTEEEQKTWFIMLHQ
eukprot:4935230-Amphidinium_carterae.1